MEALNLLLDLGDGSKKELSVERKDALDSIKEEIRRYFEQVDVVFVTGSPGSSSTGPKHAVHVQRWSSKWGEYVDISRSEDIKDKDKLRVLPKSTVSLWVRRIC